MINATISHYQIIEKIGGGGMGIVYKARDLKLERIVAVKFLPPAFATDPMAKKRFLQEAKSASALQHANICTIHEVDETSDGQMYIVMDYYEGETLKSKIQKGRMAIEESVNYTIQIARGLHEAHRKDIVHRDIKPANIIITTSGEVKILDFGLSKFKGQDKLTKTGSTLGTVVYMSPEQARGEDVDARSDLWSLGIICYEMLSGELPFKGDYDQAIVYSIINERHKPVEAKDNIPNIIDKLLNKSQSERYQSAADLLADLTKAPASEYPKSQIRKRIAVSKHLIITLATVILAAILFILVLPLLQKESVIAPPEPILVLPFENQSGDPNLDYLRAAIPNLLVTNLEQSQYVTVLTWDRLEDLLKVLGKPEMDILDIDRQTGFDLCHLEAVHSVVMGSFTRAGNFFATDIKVLDVQSKKVLVSSNSKGEGIESILSKQIDELSSVIAGSVIASGDEIEREELNIFDVTTKSMDAYRLYSEALRRYHRFDFVGADARFNQAVTIDSTFAMAHYYLSKTGKVLGKRGNAISALNKAMRFSVNTPEREALYIRMDFATDVEVNAQKALEINKKLVEMYPKEKEALRKLAAKYRHQGQLSAAINMLNQALGLDPNWRPAYNDLSYIYALSGQFDRALANNQKYIELSTGGPNPLDSRAEIQLMAGYLEDAIETLEITARRYPDWYGTFYVNLSLANALKEEYNKALRQYQKLDLIFQQNQALHNQPGLLSWNYRSRGQLYYLLGRHVEALETFRKIAPLGDEFVTAEAADLMSYIHADRGDYIRADTELQNARQIRSMVRPSDELFWNLCYRCRSAFIDIRAGNLTEAVKKMNEVSGLIQELTHPKKEIYRYWTAILEAEVLLAKGDISAAIQKFRTAEIPNPFYIGWWYRFDYYLPIHRDGLARAYEASGDTDAAIQEYTRLLTFRSDSKERFLILPIYHYRLGVLYEQSGRKDLAIREIEIFLKHWANADKDIPELIDARERLMNLTSSHNK